MDFYNFSLSNQKEAFISIQRANENSYMMVHTIVMYELLEMRVE